MTTMIRNFGIRIGILLIVLLVVSPVAHAEQGTTFRLLIQDTTNGVQRVITDNVSLGVLNINGDKNSTLGTIQFSGTVGNFFVTIDATSNTASGGGGVLTLSANVQYQSTGNHQILIAVEDTGYAAPAGTASFDTSVGGYDYSSNTVTGAGDLTGSASSIDLQAWLDAAGDVPALGANSGSTTLSPLTLPASAANNSDQQFAATGFSSPVTGNTVDLSTTPATGYSIFSAVTVNFTGTGGTADFTLTASDPITPSDSVPEPTSLLLLGSALVGFGVVRKKKQI